MRIWSLHPGYLDAKGLVALWRETLLAKNVLEGKTKGYRNHPQLIRFKKAVDSVSAINHYLKPVYDESVRRGYHFDRNKFSTENFYQERLTVTRGQLEYEWNHLLKKLRKRDIKKYHELSDVKIIECHPLFEVIEGQIEEWEIIN
ncbi:MAG: pyrimidine dimer DNA glycosylase/endonuclease V [Bacteroidales bacterium]